MEALMGWLNANGTAVTAIATAVTALAAVVGVVVSIIYALVTRRLGQATEVQAEATKAQADATIEQSDITRRIFEAAHRPYVTVRLEEPTEKVEGRLSFSVVFTNVGTVPAHVTGWRARATLLNLQKREEPVSAIDPLESPVGRSLVPNESARIELRFAGSGLADPVLPFRLRGAVEYQGAASRAYRTDFDAERVGQVWHTQGRSLK